MRLKLVIYFVICVSVLLLARVYFLSIKSNTYYQQLSEQNYIKDVPLTPVRGIIKDRNGIPLAINKLGFNITIKPHLRSKKHSKKLDSLLDTIVNNFPEFTKEKLKKRYFKLDSAYSHDYVEVIDYIEYDKFYPKYMIFNSINDFKINAVDKRFYPYGSVGAHIIGYTGKASTLDISRDIISKYTKNIGKSGLELYYNEKLQGILGLKKVKVNALNKEVDILEEIAPSRDNNIHTTIDIQLQKHIHNVFTTKDKYNQTRSGAVIVMDVENGEVLAAGSFPEYDSNIFVNGVSQKEWQKIINDFNHPFTNKLINGMYPPGSVIKMGVALAFMKHGIDHKFHVFCDGETQIGNRKFRCWKEKGHATTNFRKAVRESCDDFFYKGSLKIGIDNMSDTLSLFGFGQQTNIDQKNEFIGINPNKFWKRKKYKQSWFMGETANASIGQGFVLVTPMQIARYTAALATNRLPTPHFIKDDTKDFIVKDLEFNKKHLSVVRKGMYDVANHPKGTATRHIKTSIKVAAKTGTAQVVGIPQSEKKRMKEHELAYFKRSHAWLTTYAPYKNPKYTVTVLVEHGGHGGSAAGSIVSSIYDKLIELGHL